MKIYNLIIFFFLCFVSAMAATSDNSMRRVLNSIQHLMTGEESYDDAYFKRLTSCMEMFDPTLPKAQDEAWNGMIQFWISNGQSWGKRGEDIFENNATKTTNLEGMVIKEPCNAASKLSGYLSITKICKRKISGPPFKMPLKHLQAFVKSLTQNIFAGTFFHVSRSDNANDIIARPADGIYYLLHASIVHQLPTNSTIIKNLRLSGEVRDDINAFAAVESMQNNFLLNDYTVWANRLKEYPNLRDMLYISDYVLAITASFCVIVNPVNPKNQFTDMFQYLGNFINLNNRQRDFYLKYYIPEFQKVFSTIEFSEEEREELKQKFDSVALKFGYALAWYDKYPKKVMSGDVQLENIEEFLIGKLGTINSPLASTVARLVPQQEYFNRYLKTKSEVYPGERWCDNKYPHQKWHTLAGSSILEAIYLVDNLYGKLKSKL